MKALKILVLGFLLQGCVTHYEACRNQGYRRGTMELTYCMHQRNSALRSTLNDFNKSMKRQQPNTKTINVYHY